MQEHVVLMVIGFTEISNSMYILSMTWLFCYISPYAYTLTTLHYTRHIAVIMINNLCIFNGVTCQLYLKMHCVLNKK